MKYLICIIMSFILVSCLDKRDDFAEPSTDNVTLELSTSFDSLPADGATFGEITLIMSGDRNKYGEVEVSITPIGKFSNNVGTIKTPIDGSGKGHAYIFSDVSGLATINASVAKATQAKSFKFYKLPVDTLSLSVTLNNVPADNYTYAELTALTQKRPFANNQIVFVTDKGVFSNGNSTYSVQASFDDITKAYLKYNKGELARITATIYNSYSKEAYVTFINALPDQISISPSAGTLASSFSSNCTITANLTRTPGIVSEGQVVHFYDSVGTGLGGSIGTFLNITLSDSFGVATSTYWLQDTSYHGFVYIKGYTNSGNGVISGANKILIQ